MVQYCCDRCGKTCEPCHQPRGTEIQVTAPPWTMPIFIADGRLSVVVDVLGFETSRPDLCKQCLAEILLQVVAVLVTEADRDRVAAAPIVAPKRESAQHCGCDPSAKWICEKHRNLIDAPLPKMFGGAGVDPTDPSF